MVSRMEEIEYLEGSRGRRRYDGFPHRDRVSFSNGEQIEKSELVYDYGRLSVPAGDGGPFCSRSFVKCSEARKSPRAAS